MEETIGYEALLSADEWDSLSFGDWLDDFDPNGGYSENGPSAASPEHQNEMQDLGSEAVEISSGVATDGSGRAAQGQEVASEGNNSHSVGPSLDSRAATSCDKSQDQKSEQDSMLLEFVHEVSCRTRQLDDGNTEYALECDICDEIGTADEYEEADVIAQQHRTATSELWEVS